MARGGWWGTGGAAVPRFRRVGSQASRVWGARTRVVDSLCEAENGQRSVERSVSETSIVPWGCEGLRAFAHAMDYMGCAVIAGIA